MKSFHDSIKEKMDNYVRLTYKVSKTFPREELYGVTSQLRRSSLSVVLNYIEGYARKNPKVLLNFLRISYGSLQESRYLIHLSLVENYINKEDYNKLADLADEIGAMLWGKIIGVEEDIGNI